MRVKYVPYAKMILKFPPLSLPILTSHYMYLEDKWNNGLMFDKVLSKYHVLWPPLFSDM